MDCSEISEQVEENLEVEICPGKERMKVSRSETEYMCVIERNLGGTVQGVDMMKKVDFSHCWDFKYL